MSKPYDAASKGLFDADPMAWVRFVGLPGESAEPLDSDLTTAMASDRLFKISEPGKPDYLLHIEFQTSYETNLCHRSMVYHVLAGYKYGLPVITVIVLLRRSADGPSITKRFRFGDAQVDLHIIRLWRHSPEEVLSGPPSLIPLLPLTKVGKSELPSYIEQAQSMTDGLPHNYKREVWGRMEALMGLRFNESESHDLLRGVYQMLDLRQSSTVRAYIAEGEARGEVRGATMGERKGLLVAATKRFGEPDQASLEALQNISSEERLLKLFERLFEVTTWKDLLA